MSALKAQHRSARRIFLARREEYRQSEIAVRKAQKARDHAKDRCRAAVLKFCALDEQLTDRAIKAGDLGESLWGDLALQEGDPV